LIKRLVTQDQVATTVNASFGGSTNEYGMLYLTAAPRSGVDVLDLEKRVDGILQDVKDHGVTKEELAQAIATSEARDIYARDNPVGLGTTAADVRASGRSLNYMDAVSAALLKLTPADIQTAAQKVFDANHSVTLIMRPKH
jgi:zinc protease